VLTRLVPHRGLGALCKGAGLSNTCAVFQILVEGGSGFSRNLAVCRCSLPSGTAGGSLSLCVELENALLHLITLFTRPI
jgi:hypothetical protein